MLSLAIATATLTIVALCWVLFKNVTSRVQLSYRTRRTTTPSSGLHLHTMPVAIRVSGREDSHEGSAVLRYSTRDPFAVHLWVSVRDEIFRFRFSRDLLDDALTHGNAGVGNVHVIVDGHKNGHVHFMFTGTDQYGSTTTTVAVARRSVMKALRRWNELVPDVNDVNVTSAVDDALERLLNNFDPA